MDLSKITSNNYDFLWTVGNMPPLMISIWFNDEYKQRDFIYTYKDDVWTLYVSKEERKKLAAEGLEFFLNRYDEYEALVENQIKESDSFFQELSGVSLDGLSKQEFTDLFEKVVMCVKALWKSYFWVEYHNFDELARIVSENDVKYDIDKIRILLEKAGKLKYRQRQFLNQAWYPPSVFESFYKKLPAQLSLPIEAINYYYHPEVVDLLRGKNVKIPNRTVLVSGKFSDWSDIVEGEGKIIIDKLAVTKTNASEFKGRIGNKGNYIGKVKKISFSLGTDFSKEINLMNKGDVLVSGSTGPEMILACRKAGAIITDEGGIISHAAIVSRELGVPCVIGTKIATKILKDGDLVEVDADNGVVRIIKRIYVVSH